MTSLLSALTISHVLASYWGGPAEAVGQIALLAAAYWGGGAE